MVWPPLQHVGNTSDGVFPAGPLEADSGCEQHVLSKGQHIIASSSGGRAPALIPHALRAFLWCDFAVRSESIGCSSAHFPPGYASGGGTLLASTRSANLFF